MGYGGTEPRRAREVMSASRRAILHDGVLAHVYQKESEMNAQSLLIKILVTAFAFIGLLAVLSVLGMVFMHSGMMMSFGSMIAACRNAM